MERPPTRAFAAAAATASHRSFELLRVVVPRMSQRMLTSGHTALVLCVAGVVMVSVVVVRCVGTEDGEVVPAQGL